MQVEWLRALSVRRWGRIAQSLARAVARPDTQHFYELESAMMDLASPAQLARMAERFARSPELARAFEERYLPPPRSLDEAASYAPGTLGHAYHRFMERYGLQVDYLAPRTLEGALTWFRARQVQAHDQWHVVLGIGADIPGELEIIAVLLAQFRRALPREPLASSFSALLMLVYLLHVCWQQPEALGECLRRARRGYERGWKVGPLWAVRFEEAWAQPLNDVRASLGVT
jgi:ubiquinone biosynthesis protein COQ4